MQMFDLQDYGTNLTSLRIDPLKNKYDNSGCSIKSYLIKKASF